MSFGSPWGFGAVAEDGGSERRKAEAPGGCAGQGRGGEAVQDLALFLGVKRARSLLFPAPKSPELRLEPLNCTTLAVRWQPDLADSAPVQGYKLFYKEEGQQENPPILLEAHILAYTISGLGECAGPGALEGGRVSLCGRLVCLSCFSRGAQIGPGKPPPPSMPV